MKFSIETYILVGINYGCKEKGIPQGSPISPVFMNFSLYHQLDKQLVVQSHSYRSWHGKGSEENSPIHRL